MTEATEETPTKRGTAAPRIILLFFAVGFLWGFYSEVYALHFQTAGILLVLFAVFIPGVRIMRKNGADPRYVRGYQIVLAVLVGLSLPIALVGAIAH